MEDENLKQIKFVPKYTIKLDTKGYARDTYTVTKNYGDWCEDGDLIRLCDKYNFGGMVYKGESKATVVVYTD